MGIFTSSRQPQIFTDNLAKSEEVFQTFWRIFGQHKDVCWFLPSKLWTQIPRLYGPKCLWSKEARWFGQEGCGFLKTNLGIFVCFAGRFCFTSNQDFYHSWLLRVHWYPIIQLYQDCSAIWDHFDPARANLPAQEKRNVMSQKLPTPHPLAEGMGLPPGANRRRAGHGLQLDIFGSWGLQKRHLVPSGNLT